MTLALIAAVSTYFHFVLPLFSAGPDGCSPDPNAGPAGVRHLRTYVTSREPMSPFFNHYQPFHRISFPVAGMYDGKKFTFYLPRAVCGPGDSCGIQVSIADGATPANYACDKKLEWRLPR